jgi:hypothetical protein
MSIAASRPLVMNRLGTAGTVTFEDGTPHHRHPLGFGEGQTRGSTTA